MTSDLRRPGPLRWLWYAMGGGLPARYRAWVLHDVTTRTWALRQMVRAVVQLVPVGVVLVLLVPGELWVRLAAVLGGALVGLVYAASFVPMTTEHRAVKAGFARGEAEAVRERRNAPARQAAERRYAQRYRGGSPEDPALSPRSP
ncbi:DUF5313 family protein [Pseudonocardia sp.]|uniref:DUF5313 family protein n=1 Tax=Pseudonocardia sp. TaxID=60912 RepID=UPI00261FE196|nr:DUF5313 family protein [Pseudonocardia sp.]